MTTQTPLKNLVPPSHTLERGTAGQDENSGTSRGTSVGQLSLKYLASKVLQRDKRWDKSGTSPKNPWDKMPESAHCLSHTFEAETCPLSKLNSNDIYAEPTPQGLTLIAGYSLSESLHGHIVLWASQRYTTIMNVLGWEGEHPPRKVTLKSLNAYRLPRELPCA